MIIRREDPAVTELRRIVENDLALPCTFIYANLREANFGLDQLEDAKFPVFLFIASDVSNDEINSNNVFVRTIPIVGMMLNSIEQDGSQDQSTIDYTSEEVSPFIEEMRQLYENLIHKINHSTLTDPEKTVSKSKFSKIYAKFDRHLFGGGVDFEWTVLTNSTGCHP